jgi:REDY-like protein HapK
MPSLVVLFNLKDAAAAAAYEQWAQNTDVPTVKRLGSVDDFRVYRLANLLGSDSPSPYQYCEIIEVNNLDGLFADIGTDTMQQVAAQFQAFADNPLFIVGEQFA